MTVLSIVTINYNNASGLQKTLQSVTTQSFSGFEYIVIDGGSTDESPEIIKKYANKINYWVSEKDNGIYNALNKGIKIAEGEYILFLHSGDVLINNTMLEEIFREDHDEDIIYGDVVYFEPSENKMIETTLPDTLDLFFFFRGNLWHQAAFIKRALFGRTGLYNEEHKYVSDWQFFLETIIDGGASYKNLKKCITLYDMYNGTSIRNREGSEAEKMAWLKAKYPEQIMGLLEKAAALDDELNHIRRSEAFWLYELMLKRRMLLKLNKVIIKTAVAIGRIFRSGR